MGTIIFYLLIILLVICIGWFIGIIRDIQEKVTYIETVLKDKDRD